MNETPRSPYRDEIAEARIVALKNDVAALGALLDDATRRYRLAERMLRSERVERAEDRILYMRWCLTRVQPSVSRVVFAIFIGFLAGILAGRMPP